MKWMIIRFLWTVVVLTLFQGCRYISPLDKNSKLDSNSAVLVVNIEGNSKINYIQFTGVIPAINIHFDPLADDILAVEVPVGLKNLDFGVYSYYEDSSRVMGRVHYLVDDDPIDILERGLYVIGTLNTDTGLFSPIISDDRLALFREKYEFCIKGLLPVNFDWLN